MKFFAILLFALTSESFAAKPILLESLATLAKAGIAGKIGSNFDNGAERVHINFVGMDELSTLNYSMLMTDLIERQFSNDQIANNYLVIGLLDSVGKIDDEAMKIECAPEGNEKLKIYRLTKNDLIFRSYRNGSEIIYDIKNLTTNKVEFRKQYTLNCSKTK